MINPLIIGVSGLASSGKDTVTEMLKIYFEFQPKNIDEFKFLYYNKKSNNITNVKSFAFGDKLKEICSTMYNINLNLFYDRESKQNLYLNLTTHDLVTYSDSIKDSICTAEQLFYEYFEELEPLRTPLYISLRELMVFIGTYRIQRELDKEFFVKSINKQINKLIDTRYVILSDVRFPHETEFVKKKHGVSLMVVNDRVEILDNVAEHSLDYEEFDFTIENNGSFDDLLNSIWELVNNNIVFSNNIIDINNVSMRITEETPFEKTYEILNNLDSLNGIKFGEYRFKGNSDVIVDIVDKLIIKGTNLQPGFTFDNGDVINYIYNLNNTYYIVINKCVR